MQFINLPCSIDESSNINSLVAHCPLCGATASGWTIGRITIEGLAPRFMRGTHETIATIHERNNQKCPGHHPSTKKRNTFITIPLNQLVR